MHSACEHSQTCSPTSKPTLTAKRADLTATARGHVMLVEYLEEHPSMLGQPGMGLSLSTFYRKVRVFVCRSVLLE